MATIYPATFESITDAARALGQPDFPASRIPQTRRFIQQRYDDLRGQGYWEQPQYAAFGHSLRRRGLAYDPTQGRSEAPPILTRQALPSGEHGDMTSPSAGYAVRKLTPNPAWGAPNTQLYNDASHHLGLSPSNVKQTPTGVTVKFEDGMTYDYDRQRRRVSPRVQSQIDTYKANTLRQPSVWDNAHGILNSMWNDGAPSY